MPVRFSLTAQQQTPVHGSAGSGSCLFIEASPEVGQRCAEAGRRRGEGRDAPSEPPPLWVARGGAEPPDEPGGAQPRSARASPRGEASPLCWSLLLSAQESLQVCRLLAPNLPRSPRISPISRPMATSHSSSEETWIVQVGTCREAPGGRQGGGGFREASSTAPPRRGTRAAPTERWQAPQSRPSTARRAGCLRAAYAAVSRRGCGGTGASPRTAAPAPPRYWVCPSSTPPAAAHVARQVAAAAHPMSLKAGEESAPPDGGGVAPPPAE